MITIDNSRLSLPINNKQNLLLDSSFAQSISDKRNAYDLNIELGVNKTNMNIETLDIAEAVHILIGGTTNSGKSVCLNTIISSLISKNSPLEVQLLLIDPKQVEFAAYENIPHLIAPVINFEKDAMVALRWLVEESERRYSLLRQNRVKNIQALRDKTNICLPSIICVIDELANLIRSHNKKEMESLLMQLAEKSRASGIHLVLSTQRPSMGAVIGDLKSNLPTRIAFKVASTTDSRIVLDQAGAESLLGKGDMLLSQMISNKVEKIQGCFISDQEIDNIVGFWVEQVKALNLKFDHKISLQEKQVVTQSASYVLISDSDFNTEANRIKGLLDAGYTSEQIMNKSVQSFNALDRIVNNNYYIEENIQPKPISEKELYNQFLSYIYATEQVTIQEIMSVFSIDKKQAGNLATKAIRDKKAYRAYPTIQSPYASRDKVGILWN